MPVLSVINSRTVMQASKKLNSFKDRSIDLRHGEKNPFPTERYLATTVTRIIFLQQRKYIIEITSVVRKSRYLMLLP